MEKYGKLPLNYNEILTFVFMEKHLFLWRQMENYQEVPTFGFMELHLFLWRYMENNL